MASGVIRQERSLESLIFFRTAHGLEGRGTLLHLTRHSVTFEVYNPYSIVQLSEVLDELKILRDERPIYHGRGVVTSLVPTGALNIVSATLIDAWSDLHGLFAGDAIRAEAESFVQSWERGYRLRAEYQLAVSRLTNFLQELSRWLGQPEALSIRDPSSAFSDNELFAYVWPPLRAKLSELFQRFELAAPLLSPAETPVHRAFAQRELHPLVMCDPFFHRSFVKPLGYAGDYQMVNMILGVGDSTAKDLAPPPESDPSNVSGIRAGSLSTYARVLNSFTLGSAPSKAHRNRIDILERLLRQEARRVRALGRTLRVLDVGCGPAVEIERFVAGEEASEGSELTLFDFNEETLDYAKRQLTRAMQKTGRRVAVHTVHHSIHELLRASVRGDSAASHHDFVYCAGLFDYLSDRVCKRLLRLYYDWLSPGGLLVATNVHVSNPIRYYMEHVAEWYLEHRGEQQLLKLAPEHVPARVYADATGINLFLEIRKPEE